jgi:hypothetical protein
VGLVGVFSVGTNAVDSINKKLAIARESKERGRGRTHLIAA